jgi:glucose/arabinose dehydrogenase
MKTLPLLILLISTLTHAANVKVENLVSQNDVIWGFDFIDNDKIVFTRRDGKLFTYDMKNKKAEEVTGVPKVYQAGQAGLLDVRVHKGSIYFTYSEPVKDRSTTALGMAKLEGNKLVGFKKLFSAHRPNDNDIHYGSRIAFDGKGHLFITVGDRDERHHAQKLEFHQGKVLRFNEDGSVPKDNPYVNDKEAKPEIWSLGHRSPQGLAFRPGTDELWEAEMGPKGGDEINLIKPKANYGWPVVTYGREYWGPKIGEGTTKEGMTNPIAHWVPSISPSALDFYSGDKIPEWKGNAFLANLSGTHLRRIVLEGQKVVKEEKLFEDLGYRFRNLRTGPDGYLYFSTDEGKLGRILPK